MSDTKLNFEDRIKKIQSIDELIEIIKELEVIKNMTKHKVYLPLSIVYQHIIKKLNDIIIIVAEGYKYDTISIADNQKAINVTYTELLKSKDKITQITKHIPLTIYFVCCASLSRKKKECTCNNLLRDDSLRNNVCNFNWVSGGKKLIIIYSDWSVPLELEKSRTQYTETEKITILDDHKSSIIYPPIYKMKDAGITEIKVKRLSASVNLKDDSTFTTVAVNETNEPAYLTKKIGYVEYHVFSFHLSELTNIIGTEEQKKNLLKSIGVTEENIPMLLNNPQTMVRLMSQQSSNGCVNSEVLENLTEEKEDNVLSNDFDQNVLPFL